MILQSANVGEEIFEKCSQFSFAVNFLSVNFILIHPALCARYVYVRSHTQNSWELMRCGNRLQHDGYAHQQ